MSRWTWLLNATFGMIACLLPITSLAKESVTYQYMGLSRFPRVLVVIPKATASDRFYIQSPFKSRVIKAQALIDNQQLTPAIGNQGRLFLPEELIQGYSKTVTEVDAFPTQPFTQAHSQIRFSFYLENNQEKIYTLQGKPLQKFMNSLLHQGIKP